MSEQTTIQAKAHKSKTNGRVVGGSSATAARDLRHTIGHSQPSERTETLVIGGGQAGLSVGYQLAQRGRPFVIVDANEQIGDAWRNRWDSLRLFTPAKFNGLAGMDFPADGDVFPTKDEMADFLADYADHFDLPIRTGVRIQRLWKDGDRFIAESEKGRFEADNVVVAMSNYQEPKVPEFAGDVDTSIVQFHSIDYRNPSQLQDGGVLLVGGGNSGSEIALELARHGHDVWMSGRDTGHIPFRIEGKAGLFVLVRLVIRFVFHHVITVDTPIGRKVRPKLTSQGGPLVRVKPQDLTEAGVERVPKMAGVRDGKPVLEDGQVLDVQNVIWCTGFHPGFSWIDLPVVGADGRPRHERGLVPEVPGLYFLGLHFLYSLSSAMIHGVKRDSRRIAEAVVERMSTRAAA